MGLPGSGKTTLANALKKEFEFYGKKVIHFNADDVRTYYGDWDFSVEGRIRQAERLKRLSESVVADYTITDFIAGLEEQRTMFNADYVIWLDTIEASRYKDTNKMFMRPSKDEYDLRVTSMNMKNVAEYIVEKILYEQRYK